MLRLPIVTALILLAMPVAGPRAAIPSRFDDVSTREDVLRWIDGYRLQRDPGSVPMAVRVLSRANVFRDPESSGVYVGFLAGVIGAAGSDPDETVANIMPMLKPEEHWVLVRAIAYSGLPEWKVVLRRLAPKMPTRQVMIDKYLAGALPTIWQMPVEKPQPSWTEKLEGYFTLEGFGGKKNSRPHSDISPELLDTLWGDYYATGNTRPIAHIIAMLAWSKDKDSVEKLTLGSMARYTLALNASRATDLRMMLRRERERQPKDGKLVLDDVIDAAETMEVARLRNDALASLDDLRRKGPAYKREISFWGKVGQGTLALGCIVAAATGHVEFGLPCVIGGGATSAVLGFWDQQ